MTHIRCRRQLGYPEENMFGQVSSNGHQRSLERGEGPGMSRCTMRSHVQGGGLWGKGTGGLYNEDQCIMGNGHMAPLSLYPSFIDRQTHTSENISFPTTSLVGGKHPQE